MEIPVHTPFLNRILYFFFDDKIYFYIRINDDIKGNKEIKCTIYLFLLFFYFHNDAEISR